MKKFILTYCMAGLFTHFLCGQLDTEANLNIINIAYSGELNRAFTENQRYHLMAHRSGDKLAHKQAILNDALIANERGDYNTCIRELEKLSEKETNQHILHHYYDIYSDYFGLIGRSQLKIEYLLKAIEIGKQIDDNIHIEIENAFNELFIYYYSNRLEDAPEETFEMKGDLLALFNLLESHFDDMNTFEKKKYYEYRVYFCKRTDTETILHYANALILLGEKHDYINAKVRGWLFKALFYKRTHQNELELEAIEKAEALNNANESLFISIQSKFELMDYYIRNKNYQKAKFWGLKTRFLESVDYSNYFDVYNKLSVIYEKTGQLDSALYYKQVDSEKYKKTSRAHDDAIQLQLINRMKDNINEKEKTIEQSRIVIAITVFALILIIFLFIKIRRINQKLEVNHEALKHSYQILENFSHILSHDLNAPLHSINKLSGYIIQDEKDLSEESKSILELIHESANNAIILTTNLMSFLETKELGISFEPLTFNKIFKAAEINLNALITVNDVELNYHPNLPKHIFGHEALLVQLFQNIIQNAIKYRSENQSPVININYHTKANFGIISVQDNGIGIPIDKRDFVFKPFQQINYANKQTGIGLGLSICYNIMLYHKGKIEIDTSTKTGTRINLYFPIEALIHKVKESK